MTRINMQRHNNYQSTKLTPEPTEQIIVAPDYGNPASVIDGLTRAVIRLALKYTEGVYYVRKRGTYDDLVKLNYHQPANLRDSIDPAKDINGELFVNALLTETFIAAGLTDMMYDKHKRPYASNLIGKLYYRAFAVKEVTKERKEKMKRVMSVLNNKFISISDTEFARMMNNVLLTDYVVRCKDTHMPFCYKNGLLGDVFTLKSVSPLLKFLVLVVQNIIKPSSHGVSYKIAMANFPTIVREIKQKATNTENVSVVIPHVSDADVLANDTTKEDEKEDKEDDNYVARMKVTLDTDADINIPATCATSEVKSATVGEGHVTTTFEATKTTHMSRGFTDMLPPGKNFIDRVMALLASKEDYLELDDFNRLRAWAQSHVNELVGERVRKLETELNNLKSKYNA